MKIFFLASCFVLIALSQTFGLESQPQPPLMGPYKAPSNSNLGVSELEEFKASTFFPSELNPSNLKFDENESNSSEFLGVVDYKKSYFELEMGFLYDNNVRLLDDEIFLDLGKFSGISTNQLFIKNKYRRVFSKSEDFNLLLEWDALYVISDQSKVSDNDPLWVRVALPAVFKREFDEIQWGVGLEGFFRKSREFTSYRGPYWYGLEVFSRSFYRFSNIFLSTYFQVQKYKSYVEEKTEENKQDGINYSFAVNLKIKNTATSTLGVPLRFSFHRSDNPDNRYSRYDYGVYYEFHHSFILSRIGYDSYRVFLDDTDKSNKLYFELEFKLDPNFSFKWGVAKQYVDEKSTCDDDCREIDKKQTYLSVSYRKKI